MYLTMTATCNKLTLAAGKFQGKHPTQQLNNYELCNTHKYTIATGIKFAICIERCINPTFLGQTTPYHSS